MTRLKEGKKEKASLVKLSDGTKILNGVEIPDEENLKKWMHKHHPEYMRDCRSFFVDDSTRENNDRRRKLYTQIYRV